MNNHLDIKEIRELQQMQNILNDYPEHKGVKNAQQQVKNQILRINLELISAPLSKHEWKKQVIDIINELNILDMKRKVMCFFS